MLSDCNKAPLNGNKTDQNKAAQENQAMRNLTHTWI